LSCLTLLESFTHAENDVEPGVECGTGLSRDEFRVLVEKGATFRVTSEIRKKTEMSPIAGPPDRRREPIPSITYGMPASASWAGLQTY
jgi:hypothetical protein